MRQLLSSSKVPWDIPYVRSSVRVSKCPIRVHLSISITFPFLAIRPSSVSIVASSIVLGLENGADK